MKICKEKRIICVKNKCYLCQYLLLLATLQKYDKPNLGKPLKIEQLTLFVVDVGSTKPRAFLITNKKNPTT